MEISLTALKNYFPDNNKATSRPPGKEEHAAAPINYHYHNYHEEKDIPSDWKIKEPPAISTHFFRYSFTPPNSGPSSSTYHSAYSYLYSAVKPRQAFRIPWWKETCFFHGAAKALFINDYLRPKSSRYRVHKRVIRLEGQSAVLTTRHPRSYENPPWYNPERIKWKRNPSICPVSF